MSSKSHPSHPIPPTDDPAPPSPNTNHHSSSGHPAADPPRSIYRCHRCQSLLSIDPVQLQHIEKQQRELRSEHSESEEVTPIPSPPSIPPVSAQCVYVDCPIRSRGLFECKECSKLSQCRHCAMPLCQGCAVSLKVLRCGYCNAFICSQHCYQEIMRKHFEFMEHVGLSLHSHPTMHRFRKLLLPPHLYANIGGVPDECLPFSACEGCKLQNCGCNDWTSCANCRRYYCSDCEETRMQKCALEECRSRTCCRQKEWSRNCELCMQMGRDCGNIFCTKGHCTRHVILQSEHGFDFVEAAAKGKCGDDEKDAEKESNLRLNDTDLNQHE